MDTAGVDAALLTAVPFYGSDNSYAIHAARTYPGRLAVVAWPDWRSPEPKRWLETLISEPAVVGIRLSTWRDARPWGPGGEFDPMLTAAEELGVPVAVFTGSEGLPVLSDVASRHSRLALVVDQLGLDAPPYYLRELGPRPFDRLPDLLALAEHPNVRVKLNGIPALSKQSYPFHDIWEPIASVVAAFGAERLMWGSDYQRTAPLHTYREAVDYLAEIDLLSDSTKQTLYSRGVRAVFGWPTDNQVSS